MKMKLLSVVMLATVWTFGQSNSPAEDGKISEAVNAQGQTVTTYLPADFKKTVKVTELPEFIDNIPAKERKLIRNDRDRSGYEEGVTAPDPVVQTEMGERMLRTPLVNFNGLSGSGLPPDPSGAAGPNHYVQGVNTSVRVYNKDGSIIPGATFSLSSFWSGSSNAGDPIIMYDRHADRWFISQFQFSPNQILIAVSETNDPTGSYYAYSFNMSSFPDYPKYSIWWDGYYMTSNSNQTAVVFERDKMIAGDPSAQMVVLSLPNLASIGFRSPLSADADGQLPPNGTPCYFFNLEDDAMSGASQDAIQVYEMTTDWTNTSNTQVVSGQQISVPSFNSIFTGGFANIAQPGTSQRIDAIMGVLMFRAQHNRFLNHNSVVLSHAVNMGSNRSAVRWYELRDAHDGVWSVYQSGTFDPDNSSRWMSSIGMDYQGNIGMGYSICNANSTIYPGIRYTGRLFQDAPGDMSFAEQTAISGQGSQTFADRYGDYGHLSLDPNGTTFWYTGEYLGAGGAARTRIFSFDLTVEAGLEANPYYANLDLNAFVDGQELVVDVAGIHNHEEVQVDLIGMNGKAVYEVKNLQPNDSELNERIDISQLNSGVYFVRVANNNFQESKRVVITK